MDYVEPDEFVSESLDSGIDLTEVTVSIFIKFKSGTERTISLNLPVETPIYDTPLTASNIMDFIGTPYNFSEGAFLALPTDDNGSHIFLSLDSTDYIEVLR